MNAESIYRLLVRIPKGRVTTYRILAEAAGNPKACRAVGQILKRNPEPVKVPCHRVVCSDGRIGGYSGHALVSIRRKIRLLRSEGVAVTGGRIPRVKNLPGCLFTEFRPAGKRPPELTGNNRA